jgi:hypothetical protein
MALSTLRAFYLLFMAFARAIDRVLARYRR